VSLFNRDVYEKISSKCAEYGANLLVVTKTQSVDAIQELYEYGQRHFGENKLQDALPKIEVLPKDIVWHFLGALQTNKVKKVIESFSCIHSVDRISLVEELVKRACKIPVFLQVNVSGEKSKGGFSKEEFPKAVAAADELNVIGVMTMAEQGASAERLRSIFALTKSMGIEAGLKECSMGMSEDYEVALEEGATIIRIGRALFQ